MGHGSRSLGCSRTMFRRDGPRFPPGTKLVPEQNFFIPANISLYILVPLAALQNPRCFPCDLANFAFGTMVPEHLTSLAFVLKIRSCSGTFFDFFDFAENHKVPGEFNSKGAPLLSSLKSVRPSRRHPSGSRVRPSRPDLLELDLRETRIDSRNKRHNRLPLVSSVQSQSSHSAHPLSSARTSVRLVRPVTRPTR